LYQKTYGIKLYIHIGIARSRNMLWRSMCNKYTWNLVANEVLVFYCILFKMHLNLQSTRISWTNPWTVLSMKLIFHSAPYWHGYWSYTVYDIVEQSFRFSQWRLSRIFSVMLRCAAWWSLWIFSKERTPSIIRVKK
jgi:hypothetical protein